MIAHVCGLALISMEYNRIDRSIDPSLRLVRKRHVLSAIKTIYHACT